MNIKDILEQNFGMVPTQQQRDVFALLEKFLPMGSGEECFLLKGYAGTGKTTMISALVKVLPRVKLKSVLLAPTGRAAKGVSRCGENERCCDGAPGWTLPCGINCMVMARCELLTNMVLP